MFTELQLQKICNKVHSVSVVFFRSGVEKGHVDDNVRRELSVIFIVIHEKFSPWIHSCMALPGQND